MVSLLLDKLLQTPKSLLSQLQHVVRLAHSEAEIIFDNVGIGVGEEFGRRNGSDPKLLDEEPSQLEVARPACHVGWKRVVLRHLNSAQVDHDKVAALGLREWDPQLVPDLVEEIHAPLHVSDAFVPEAFLLGLFKA